jgi:DNA polymerase
MEVCRGPSTDIECVNYAIGDGPISQWRPGASVPAEIGADIAAGLPIIAYGVSFERAIWCRILTPRYEWPKPGRENWHCTAAMAATLALPDAFEQAAAILGLSPEKRGSGLGFPQHTVKRAGECAPVSVIATERTFLKVLHPLLLTTQFEREVWVLDQMMNERGISVDLELVRHAQVIVERVKSQLDAELRLVTEGKVAAATQIEKLRAWCRRIQHLQLGSLNHGEVQKALTHELELDPRVRRALEIRLQPSKTSTSKLPSFLDRTGADGRMRDNFVYHGASTGRWTAQGAGLQNLPAPPQL